VEDISHSTQGKIAAAIQQLGDKSFGSPQALGQFFPGNLFLFNKSTKNFSHFQYKFFLCE